MHENAANNLQVWEHEFSERQPHNLCFGTCSATLQANAAGEEGLLLELWRCVMQAHEVPREAVLLPAILGEVMLAFIQCCFENAGLHSVMLKVREVMLQAAFRSHGMYTYWASFFSSVFSRL